MKFSRALVTACIFLVSLSAFAQDPPLPTHPLITPERVEALTKGEAVVVKIKEPSGKGKAAATAAALQAINAPAQQVYDTIRDMEKQPEYMPRLVSVTSYEMPAPEKGYEFTIKVLWKTVVYHLRVTEDPAKLHLQWTLDPAKKNDIVKTDGTWDVLPWGDKKSIVVYQLEVDSGIAVPKFASQMMLNNDLPGVVDALKQRVESGGTYKKEE